MWRCHTDVINIPPPATQTGICASHDFSGALRFGVGKLSYSYAVRMGKGSLGAQASC